MGNARGDRDEEHGVAPAAYRRVAAVIRDAIEAGELTPGTTLDTSKQIAAQHGITQETALKALRLLATEGYIVIPARQRAVVRDRPAGLTVVRDRHAYRDEIGYHFDQNAKHWRAVGAPTRGFRVPPAHVAALLDVPRGEDVVIRDRAMGPPGAGRAVQLTTSYIPMALATVIPELRAERTGPGGIYDRIEEHFRAPIAWRETISARLPDEEEQQRLGVPGTVPLLVVTRESHVPGRDAAVEVNETRLAAEQFAVSYEVQRDLSAAWPRADRP